MQDIRITFSGDGSDIDLSAKVEGKALYMQKATVNIATEAGSDAIYEDRGTALLSSAISGAMVDRMMATHYGNFAALDTLSFINLQEYAAVSASGDLVRNIDVATNEYSIKDSYVEFTLTFEFADGTTTEQTSKVNYV